MGLTKSAFRFLIREAKARPFSGSLLTLGVQDIYCTEDELELVAKQEQFLLSPPSTHLLNRLGFKTVETIDCSPYEGASILFDLNSSELPASLHHRFDTILDAGTLEHIFHLPNGLRNISNLLKPEGRIIHIAPSSNYLDHGFYSLSPTLFWDYYNANQFAIEKLQTFRSTLHHRIDRWEAFDYTPGCLEPINTGGLDNGLYGTLCVVRKTETSTTHQIPTQYRYQHHLWNQVKARPNRWKLWLKQNKLLYRGALFFKKWSTKKISWRQLANNKIEKY